MLSTDRVINYFKETFTGKATHRVMARGRINLIGEHTDYNDGWVMPAAIDKGIFFAARLNSSSQVRLSALDVDQTAEFSLRPLTNDGPLWLRYVKGICDQFHQRGFTVPGFDCVFGGDLPLGAGMSSSAALETGFATLLNAMCQAEYTNPDLARLAKQSSNDFVGIPCGIMDQFASLMGQVDHFVQLDCRSLNHSYISAALPEALEWVLVNSNVSHELANSAYPQRVQECREGVARLQTFEAKIESLRDVSLDFLERHKNDLPATIYRRCAYVVAENERVHRAARAMQASNWSELGKLLLQTHAGLRDAYEVSCPEVDFLVAEAAASTAALGARIMGGGFGGCSINLLRRATSDAFLDKLLTDYRNKFGITAEVYRVNIADGTRLL